MYSDLRGFVRKMEEQVELIHIRDQLSPKFEISAVIKYLTREKNLALFFDDVEGYNVPVVGNLLGTKKRLALALGIEEIDLTGTYTSRRENPVKPVLVSDGPVKQVEILRGVDIAKTIPVLTHHEKDAGPYFTCAIVMARDPETGVRGMGIHRIQVKDSNTIGIFLASPPLSHFLARSEAKGAPLEIAVILGPDPITFFSSVIFAPSGVDKLDIAGSLAGAPIETVKCSTIDVEVPAHAEFVLEGEIIPGERQTEGPFGESTGYYFAYRNPIAKIKAITHRIDPVYQALVPFSNEETVLLDLLWELEHLKEVQRVYPVVRKVHLTSLGLTAIAQIKKGSDTDSRKLIEHLWSNSYAKVVIVVDEDVDPYDWAEVNWAVATRVQAMKDIMISGEMNGLVIDPSTGPIKVSDDSLFRLAAVTSKMGIDATKPLSDLARYEKIDVPEGVKAKIRPIIDAYLKT